jgi:hypothetical protein
MQKKEEKIIMYDSPEAASVKTGLSGWVSANGHYCGKDEHLARWDGCTHRQCECGHIYEKTWVCCEKCRQKKSNERYLALPHTPFEQVECCMLWDDDKFFFSHEDVEEYLEENNLQPEDIRLQVCEAKTGLSRVDEEQWREELPEDHELPPEIQEAIKALNEAISKHSPTVWWGIEKRTTFVKSE